MSIAAEGSLVAPRPRFNETSCQELTQLACVFIIALGRTGSTHLLRLLNSISGYRLSGETDNAWVFFGWFARARLGLTDDELFNGTVVRHARRRGSVAADPKDSWVICGARQMMLLLHNPLPRARVFGFKEIYSPFVRHEHLTPEIFRQGVHFVRLLFPRAKFIFHYRRNFTRIENSDFWQQEGSRANHTKSQFVSVSRQFHRYALHHPDHAFVTTIDELTNRSDAKQLEQLFSFLGEPLTPKLRKLASSRASLHDWSEEKHRRRIKHRTSDGSVIVETKDYAFRPQSAS